MDNLENEIKSGAGSHFENQRLEKERQVQTSLDLVVSKHRNRKKLTLGDTVKEVVDKQPEAIVEKVMRTHDRMQKYAEEIRQYNLPDKLVEEIKEYQIPDRLFGDLQEKNVPGELLAELRKYQMPIERVEELKKYRVPGRILDAMTKKEVNIEARETMASYIDKRIDMPNRELAKLEMMRAMGEILDNDPKIEDLKRVARVSFDLNGLKVVNDFSGTYEKGDLYLQLMKKAMENDGVKQWVIDHKIKYTACREGGDEFSAILVSEKDPLDENMLNEFIRMVKGLLENDNEAENCLNMDDDDTILRWKHKIPAEEGRKLEIEQLRAGGREISDDYKLSSEEKVDADRLGEEWKIKALAEYRQEIPSGFKFKGRVAASAATVYDGLMDQANQEKRIIREDDTYESGLVKTMDCTFATGDRGMHGQKEIDKGGMAKSDDPGERFLVRLYNSTRSAEQDVELEKEKKIREALERSSAFKSELINLKDKLYESDHALEENEISELKLAIIVKKREIEDAEDKVSRLKE